MFKGNLSLLEMCCSCFCFQRSEPNGSCLFRNHPNSLRRPEPVPRGHGARHPQSGALLALKPRENARTMGAFGAAPRAGGIASGLKLDSCCVLFLCLGGIEVRKGGNVVMFFLLGVEGGRRGKIEVTKKGWSSPAENLLKRRRLARALRSKEPPAIGLS